MTLSLQMSALSYLHAQYMIDTATFLGKLDGNSKGNLQAEQKKSFQVKKVPHFYTVGLPLTSSIWMYILNI